MKTFLRETLILRFQAILPPTDPETEVPEVEEEDRPIKVEDDSEARNIVKASQYCVEILDDRNRI